MANLGITVNVLEAYCKAQIQKGNGHKHILISDDDEGNGFHTLFYGFSDSDDDGFDFMVQMEHDGTHTPDNCVILG